MRKREEIRGRGYSSKTTESLFTDMDRTKEVMVEFPRVSPGSQVLVKLLTLTTSYSAFSLLRCVHVRS